MHTLMIEVSRDGIRELREVMPVALQYDQSLDAYCLIAGDAKTETVMQIRLEDILSFKRIDHNNKMGLYLHNLYMKKET